MLMIKERGVASNGGCFQPRPIPLGLKPWLLSASFLLPDAIRSNNLLSLSLSLSRLDREVTIRYKLHAGLNTIDENTTFPCLLSLSVRVISLLASEVKYVHVHVDVPMEQEERAWRERAV